jgi:hypothetical protein
VSEFFNKPVILIELTLKTCKKTQNGDRWSHYKNAISEYYSSDIKKTNIEEGGVYTDK